MGGAGGHRRLRVFLSVSADGAKLSSHGPSGTSRPFTKEFLVDQGFVLPAEVSNRGLQTVRLVIETIFPHTMGKLSEVVGGLP